MPNGLERALLRTVSRTIRRLELIQDGDRVAIAVSGGKDSLTLARLLRLWQEERRVRYELLAIHVLYSDEAAVVRQAQLQALMDAWDIPIVFPRMEVPPGEPWPVSCQRCAWHRRRTLFQTAYAMGYTKIALAHHQDDILVTALMNLLFQGRFEGMAPKREMFGGKLTIIRPLAEVPEADIRRYVRKLGLDVSQTSFACPVAPHTKRAEVKELLRQLEQRYPTARANLLRGLSRCSVASLNVPKGSS